MIPRLLLLPAALAVAVAAEAGPRTSASYTIASDTSDHGGRRAISASYTNDGSTGSIAGLSAVANPAETAKHGYVAQLSDVTGLALTAATLAVNEGATDQLAAWQALDDSTFLAVPATSVTWSVASGPLTGVSAGGLATAATVYQHTAATAQGVDLGDTGMLSLTVRNVNTDDYGSYAGDMIDDAWQGQYFGLENPNASAAADPDRDGQTNFFEFLAGLVPTDPQSRFTLTIAPVTNQPTQKALIFSPIMVGRSYTVEVTSSLTPANWQPLSGASQSDNGNTRTVTDLSGTGPARFYRVLVRKP